ncbi:MAG: hypothetical protein V4689_00980 [Verrucomicrobiota bacterium]
MKCIPALTAIAAMSLVACETFNAPISSGDFDPLSAPGSERGATATSGPSFSAGQFVRASIDNTAFFKTRPKGDADADKLLPRGTSMKVISTSGSYVKVELDSGDIGFVPSVMLEDPNATLAAPVPGTNEYQVYPPLPGSGAGLPLPPIDPSGLPPEGAIPTVIDPDAPSPTTPVPPVTPTTDTFPTPPETKVPLPPNEEEATPEKVEPKVEQE